MRTTEQEPVAEKGANNRGLAPEEKRSMTAKHVVNGNPGDGWYCYECPFFTRDVEKAAKHEREGVSVNKYEISAYVPLGSNVVFGKSNDAAVDKWSADTEEEMTNIITNCARKESGIGEVRIVINRAKCPNPNCVNGMVGNVGCSICEGGALTAKAVPNDELAHVLKVLMGECDRNWANETPIQIAQVALNAAYWKGRAEAEEKPGNIKGPYGIPLHEYYAGLIAHQCITEDPEGDLSFNGQRAEELILEAIKSARP